MHYVTYLKQELLKENFSVWLILAASVMLVARSSQNYTPGPKLLVNSKCPSFSQQCDQAARKGNHITGCTKHGIAS